LALERSQLSNKRAIKWVLAALVVLVVADGVLTNELIDRGIAREGNPFLQQLAGTGGLIAIKAAGAFACALILWDIYRKWPSMGVFGAYGASLFYLIIVVWNFVLFITGR
jgi:hypothetical protein